MLSGYAVEHASAVNRQPGHQNDVPRSRTSIRVRLAYVGPLWNHAFDCRPSELAVDRKAPSDNGDVPSADFVDQGDTADWAHDDYADADWGDHY